MKSAITISGLALLILFMTSLSTVKDDKAKPRIQRIVCFKFKSGTADAARLKHAADFAAFVKEIPQVLSYRAGKTVKGESKTDPTFDVMHYLTFEKEQDIITYDVHPAHKKFIEANKGSWETVLAVNGSIEK
jgi:hypothetical protein